MNVCTVAFLAAGYGTYRNRAPPSITKDSNVTPYLIFLQLGPVLGHITITIFNIPMITMQLPPLTITLYYYLTSRSHFIQGVPFFIMYKGAL